MIKSLPLLVGLALSVHIPAAMAESKVEAELRARLAASEASRIAAAKDKAELASALASLKRQADERARIAATNAKAAIIEHQVTVKKVDAATEKVQDVTEKNLEVSKKTEEAATSAAQTAVSLVNPLWFTFGMAVLSVIGSFITYLKTREVKINVNSRMDQLIAGKDEQIANAVRFGLERAIAERAAGKLEGKSEEKDHPPSLP